MAAPGTPSQLHVLVFSKTTPNAYRHESIPAGIEALKQLSSAHESDPSKRQIKVTATEDAAVFTAQRLAEYKVIVFLQSGGDFLDTPQLEALKHFVAEGGGVVGVHAATTGMPTRRKSGQQASEREAEEGEVVDADGWYGKLLGAEFDQHPEPQWGEVILHDSAHPIMRQASAIIRQEAVDKTLAEANTASGHQRWRWFDEWYNFKEDPRQVLGSDNMTVLLSVDEASYKGGTMGRDHVIAWCHEFGPAHARVFYTALGHFDQAYRDSAFTAHLRDGILWAAAAL